MKMRFRMVICRSLVHGPKATAVLVVMKVSKKACNDQKWDLILFYHSQVHLL